MNGGQDLGGMMGLGPVAPEADEPIFHGAWERRAFALTLAMGATGEWNIDRSRFARENRHPVDYLSKSYYQLWLAGLETLLAERGLVGADEIAAGQALHPARPVRVLAADRVAAALARGSSAERPADAPARFAPGDAVVCRVLTPESHTRLPRYLRGRPGTIERIHGCHVFPDSAAAGRGDDPQWLYSVAFKGTDVWGADGDPALTLRVDLWEPYLEPA